MHGQGGGLVEPLEGQDQRKFYCYHDSGWSPRYTNQALIAGSNWRGNRPIRRDRPWWKRRDLFVAHARDWDVRLLFHHLGRHIQARRGNTSRV